MPRNAEQNFINLCDQAGISWKQIPISEEVGMKTPDFEIDVSGYSIVVEVKQFDPNCEEQQALDNFLKKRFASFPNTKSGARVRKAVDKAAPQLKTLSKGKTPTMIVLQSNVQGIHADPYDIMTAMQGFDTVTVATTKAPNFNPSFGSPRSGPDKRMTTNHNTTISAVAVIRKNQKGGYILDVYHNKYATNPIATDRFRLPGIYHWMIPQDSTSSLVNWESI